MLNSPLQALKPSPALGRQTLNSFFLCLLNFFYRSRAKKLLKKPIYRTSFQMFREFAMLEAALAQKMQPAEKILTATILGARASGKTHMEKFENLL